jgi:hypothetical protein
MSECLHVVSLSASSGRDTDADLCPAPPPKAVPMRDQYLRETRSTTNMARHFGQEDIQVTGVPLTPPLLDHVLLPGS